MKSILMILISLLGISCSSIIRYDDLISIKKGMNPDDIINLVNESPKEVHKFYLLDKKYMVYSFNMQEGTEETTETSTSNNVTTTTTTTHNVSSPYYFLFEDNINLIFWGWLHEYFRHDDFIINEAGAKIKRNGDE